MSNTTGAGSSTKPVPPGLGIFLAALRWQESGSPAGNYVEPNGQGAYQIIQSNWPTWARQYAGYVTSDPNASHAPKAVQDRVAAGKVTAYYYGAAEQNYRLVARLWNGGSTNPVPNPALGPGATTDTYASALLAKADQLAHSPQASTYNKAVPGDTGYAAPTSSTPTNPSAGICWHSVTLPGPLPTLCMDKPLAALGVAAGGALILAGTAILVVTLARDTAAGRAATNALAVTAGGAAIARRAGGAAAAQRPAARRERRAEDEQRRESEEARRTEPARAAQRRQEAHDARMIRARRTPTRSGPGINDGRSTASIVAANRARNARRTLPEEAPF